MPPEKLRQHIGFRPDGSLLDCPDRTLHAVGKYTDKMMRVGGGKMPVWMLLQALANESWFNPKHRPGMAGETIDKSKILYPTYEQMRFMIFDSIINGATGIALSMWKTPVDSSIWLDITRVVKEIRGLNDGLTAPPCRKQAKVAYTDIGYSIWDGVQTLARQKDDDIYLFTANTSFDPAEVAITMPGLPGQTTATVLGEDRQVAVTRGKIDDKFAPFGVHIYKIRAKA